MSHHKNTTQTPNILFDDLLKFLTDTELRVLLTVIRKTIGIVDSSDSKKRVERAWITQRLFSICTGKSRRAVSQAIDSLVQKELIEVTDHTGTLLKTKGLRRGASRLYYASRLRLEKNQPKASDTVCQNPVTQGHTIKLNNIKLLRYNTSQGVTKLSNVHRFEQIQQQLTPTTNK